MKNILFCDLLPELQELFADRNTVDTPRKSYGLVLIPTERPADEQLHYIGEYKTDYLGHVPTKRNNEMQELFHKLVEEHRTTTEQLGKTEKAEIRKYYKSIYDNFRKKLEAANDNENAEIEARYAKAFKRLMLIESMMNTKAADSIVLNGINVPVTINKRSITLLNYDLDLTHHRFLSMLNKLKEKNSMRNLIKCFQQEKKGLIRSIERAEKYDLNQSLRIVLYRSSQKTEGYYYSQDYLDTKGLKRIIDSNPEADLPKVLEVYAKLNLASILAAGKLSDDEITEMNSCSFNNDGISLERYVQLMTPYWEQAGLQQQEQR